MYNSLSEHLKNKYGCKVYKLALDGGMTCPNRDGTLDTGGCIFCNGSGDFAEKQISSVFEQIEAAKARVAAKNGSGKYIAYFQSYTNTYAPIPYLRRLFTEAINHPDIAALSIATRPDCLGSDVLELLSELNGIKPVSVELGLQTCHESTAQLIRRCYPNSVYEKAVRNLHDIGCEAVTHMIIGLPFETRDMMLETADYIAACGSDGIKLQLLHVLKNTELAELYAAGKLETLSIDEYTEILADIINRLPEGIVIHRLTGDGAKKHLIAPLWSANKRNVLNSIYRYFAEHGVRQGSAVR